jgi:hypothetical protein
LTSIRDRQKKENILIRPGSEIRFRGEEAPDGAEVILPGAFYNNMFAEIEEFEDVVRRLRVWFNDLDGITRAKNYEFFKKLNPQIVESNKK